MSPIRGGKSGLPAVATCFGRHYDLTDAAMSACRRARLKFGNGVHALCPLKPGKPYGSTSAQRQEPRCAGAIALPGSTDLVRYGAKTHPSRKRTCRDGRYGLTFPDCFR